jgi:hypothetical protein
MWRTDLSDIVVHIQLQAINGSSFFAGEPVLSRKIRHPSENGTGI